ncbi:MAG TPA: ParB N-terminal domain-containing protein, partial [Planctomycetota bacterium]|nr:ParB N-terminal domain-containing protein [Planctomycetota bacterium]
KPRASRKKTAEPASRGLTPAQMAAEAPSSLAELQAGILADGGRVLAAYRDPLGGHWQLLAALPLEKVQPTPYQRDLSETHAKRLTGVLGKLDRFLDPIIVVRQDGGYWTPNGNHRRAALAALGARSITALVVPEPEIAFQILALNTEKAHNLREKSLEVVRMARALAALPPLAEEAYATQFEEPALLTLGLCYEQRGRFAGGAYNPVLRRVDAFMSRKLPAALELREARAKELLAIDDAVSVAVEALKAKGFQSPYLKAFVVARCNPIRFSKAEKPDYDETLAKMLAAAKKFDAGKVRADQIASSGGPPSDD